MYRKKTTIIIVMCVAMFFMAVGFALLSTKLKISGSTAVTSSWKVEFSGIRTANLKGGATNKFAPSVTATTATFHVDLVQPGDEVTYEIDITNYGDIKAEVKGATYSIEGSNAIYVEIDGIRKGTVIEHCEGLEVCPLVTAIIKVGYNPIVEKDPTEKTKTIDISLDIGQYVADNPTADGELIPELVEDKTLATQILKDNSVQSDSNIDFSKSSAEDGTSGLYYTSDNTENNQVTYYFRGNVDNNYVSFAKDEEGNGIIWRIVRINEDGSIRLVKETNTSSSVFNNNFDNTDVGFMYGQTGASSYELTHTNTNDSDIKDVLDTWYTSNLSSYSNYLADAGFCNDRSIAPEPNLWDVAKEDGYNNNSDTALGYGKNATYYGSYNRLVNLNQPQFACPQTNDLFTLKGSSKGNKSLDNSIGLLTIDEVVYAGGKIGMTNKEYYLVNGDYWWTMSPPYFNGYAHVWYVNGNGDVYRINAVIAYGVRPVINLKSNVGFTLEGTGDAGTDTNPYIIKVN